MMIATITARLLQSVEFLRTFVANCVRLFWSKALLPFRFGVIGVFIWGVIRLSISVFRLFCTTMQSHINAIQYSGIQVGGTSVLSIANTVFPVDECVAMIIAWFALYAVCASIRFIRAAWAAIPLKAT